MVLDLIAFLAGAGAYLYADRRARGSGAVAAPWGYQLGCSIPFAATFVEIPLPLGRGVAPGWCKETRIAMLAALGGKTMVPNDLTKVSDFTLSRPNDAGFVAAPILRAASAAGLNIWLDADAALKLGGGLELSEGPVTGKVVAAALDGDAPGGLPWATPKLVAESLDPNVPRMRYALLLAAGEAL